MNKVIIFLLVLAALFFAAITVGYAVLGFPGALLGFILCVGLCVVAVKVIKRRVKKMIFGAFELKGAVLKDARVDIHHVLRTNQPSDWEAENEDDDAPKELKWFEIDATITPASAAGESTPFSCWDPCEIEFVDFQTAPQGLEEYSDNDCVVDRAEIFIDGNFTREYPDKIAGNSRVKFVVGLPAHLKRCRLCYYGHSFGDVTLPG